MEMSHRSPEFIQIAEQAEADLREILAIPDTYIALGGHRSVGGMRASLYNAMPEAGVDALIAFMADFEQRYS